MWPLSASGAISMSDASVKADTLTNNGTVTAVSGVRGMAGSFNGSTQSLSCTDGACGGTSKTDIGTGNFTVGAWIKTTATGQEFIMGKGTTADFSWTFTVNSSAANKLGLTLHDSAGNAYNHTPSTTSVNDGSWHFGVATWTASGTTIRIYVDGVLEATDSTVSGSFNNNSAAAFYVGNRADLCGSCYFVGSIDEPFISGTILTDAQIQQMYVAGKEALNNKYRVKLASDTVNQLAGSINVVKGVAASDQYIFAGTNTTGADDGILSRTLLRGDVTDRTYDESTTDPVIVDNDINSVAVSKDGAYIVVGTDDAGITIIQNGSAANRLRAGSKIQGPYKRPHN